MAILKKTSLLSLTIVVGVLGALAVGFAVGHSWHRDDLTPTQVAYVNGVAAGVEFQYTDPDPPTACVRRFYPDSSTELGGCLHAVQGEPWRVP